jgi:hypothetical protein
MWWLLAAVTIRLSCCGQYAKRTRKADNSAAGVIGSISKRILGS